MSLRNFVRNRIDGLSVFLEAFDGQPFVRGCYRYLKKINQKNFITVYKEPYVYVNSGPVYRNFENVGIVLQGPVMHEDNFTVETIRMIREWYPDICIVLSTWIGSLLDNERSEVEKYKCIVIESEQTPEEFKGKNEKIGHMNNQILSSRVGTEYLRNNGIEYAMKIRSDLRIYKADFVPYLLNTLKIYKRSLVNIAFSNSMYNVPFHMSDFVWFGEIESIKQMYSIPYRNDSDLKEIVKFVEGEDYEKYKKEFNELRTTAFSLDTDWFNECHINKRFLIQYHEEIYLPYHYWKSMNLKEENNLLETYYKFLANVIVIDEYYLQIYWNKNLYSIIQSDYSQVIEKRLSHSKWLEIYLSRGKV